jgi:acyl-CoA thioesterase FadM
MNLWLRLLFVLMTAPWRGRIALPAGVSARSFRVWPGDLDAFGHMNNGRYLTKMDLGRLDLLMRSGLWRIVLKDRLSPMVGLAAVRFRRELSLLQRYRLETRIAGWTDRLAVIEQRFILETGARTGEVAAVGLVHAGLYDRRARGFVPVGRLMSALGIAAENPPPTPEIAAFLALDGVLRRPTA